MGYWHAICFVFLILNMSNFKRVQVKNLFITMRLVLFHYALAYLISTDFVVVSFR